MDEIDLLKLSKPPIKIAHTDVGNGCSPQDTSFRAHISDSTV